MSVVDDLIAARDVVSRGWCQGVFQRGGNFCAVGAILEAVGSGHQSQVDRCGMVQWELHKRMPEEYISVPHFNDAALTTQDDVLNLFDKALAELGGLG